VQTKVVAVRCENYNQETVEASLERALSHFEISKIIPADSRCFIKINHLGHHPVESAINTHPDLAYGVARFISRFTKNVTVGDGLEKNGLDYYDLSGYLEKFKGSEFELLNLRGTHYPDTRVNAPLVLQSVPFAEEALNADVLITLPKMKTHMLTFITGAVKNHYGFLPYKMRKNLHKEYPDLETFSKAVVDIYSVKLPQLVIMDAVIALEGYGPSRAGKPRRLGVLIVGTDAVAVDVIAARMMEFDPTDIDTIRFAGRRRLGTSDLSRIEYIREKGVPDVVRGYARPITSMRIKRIVQKSPQSVRRFLGWVTRSLKEVPVVVKGRCIGCGKCVLHCPMQSIKMIDRCAVIDPENCINCFCCQEFCESDAVALRYNFAGKIMVRLIQIFNAVKKTVRRKK